MWALFSIILLPSFEFTDIIISYNNILLSPGVSFSTGNFSTGCTVFAFVIGAVPHRDLHIVMVVVTTIVVLVIAIVIFVHYFLHLKSQTVKIAC